ncbi:hypothetical protein [Desulfosporosinus acidiphilus]|uniref:hypothetical protein n=1 Tax=Desulfosporosinus acidiphilus TaxID=885581 RepID=UPI0011D1AEA0|nr:hypothetical protein [Desulfosporosinus acidiphilus]
MGLAVLFLLSDIHLTKQLLTAAGQGRPSVSEAKDGEKRPMGGGDFRDFLLRENDSQICYNIVWATTTLSLTCPIKHKGVNSPVVLTYRVKYGV